MAVSNNCKLKDLNEIVMEAVKESMSTSEIIEPAEIIPRRFPKLSKDQEAFIKIVEDYNKNPEIIEPASLPPRLYGPYTPIICEDCGRKAARKKAKELIEIDKKR